ncbi:MAG: S8 family serine peptidase [Polyangiaceae bacterium]
MRFAEVAPLLLIGLVVPSLATAAPTDRASFLDGGRRVEVLRRGPADERAAPAAEGLSGRWSRVEITFPRYAPVGALVDETAILTVDPGTDLEDALAGAGVEVVRPLMPAAGLYLVRDTTGGDGVDAATRVGDGSRRARGVREIVPNLYVHMRSTGSFTPNDPQLGGQWYFKNLKMEEAWGLSKGDASETIVVVDTGCDMTHVDLVAKMDPGRDVIDEDDDPSPVLSENGAAHGTACAGLSAAVTDNAEGIAGGCPACRLRCVRLINDTALPISKSVEAFQFALDTNAAIVTNSWGYTEAMPAPKALADAINLVFDTGRSGKGAIVVFAMGNDDREVGADELEGVRGVLGVGAITNLDQTTSFTNFGAPVDVVAPTGTLSTDITGVPGFDKSDYTVAFGGTSSACPVVAGIMGLLVGAAPDKTSAELYDIVVKTARAAPFAEPDANGHDPLYGYGIIDPVKALQTALGQTAGVGGAGGTGGAGGGGGAVNDGGGCSCSLEAHGDGPRAWFALGAIPAYWIMRRARSRATESARRARSKIRSS